MFTHDLFDKGVALANLNNFDRSIVCFDKILRSARIILMHCTIKELLLRP